MLNSAGCEGIYFNRCWQLLFGLFFPTKWQFTVNSLIAFNPQLMWNMQRDIWHMWWLVYKHSCMEMVDQSSWYRLDKCWLHVLCLQHCFLINQVTCTYTSTKSVSFFPMRTYLQLNFAHQHLVTSVYESHSQFSALCPSEPIQFLLFSTNAKGHFLTASSPFI
jgi:hypothetical protein